MIIIFFHVTRLPRITVYYPLQLCPINQFSFTNEMRNFSQSLDRFPLIKIDVRTFPFSDVNLTRSPNFVGAAVELLFPVGEPTCDSGDSE